MFVNAQKIFGRRLKKLLPVVASGKGDWTIMRQDREVFSLYTLLYLLNFTPCAYIIYLK